MTAAGICALDGLVRLRVLVACEFSGTVRDAFRALGHDAMSCDLLPTEAEGPHYQGDVRDVLTPGRWDLMIAPCRFRGAMVREEARGASGGVGLRAPAAGHARAAHRAGEPGEHHFQPRAEAGPDHPAVAARARRDKGDMSLAGQPAQARADKGGGRARGPRVEDASQPEQVARAFADVPRNRGSYGRAMGLLCNGEQSIIRFTPKSMSIRFPKRCKTRAQKSAHASTVARIRWDQYHKALKPIAGGIE